MLKKIKIFYSISRLRLIASFWVLYSYALSSTFSMMLEPKKSHNRGGGVNFCTVFGGFPEPPSLTLLLIFHVSSV